jgi:hypothetical protein
MKRSPIKRKARSAGSKPKKRKKSELVAFKKRLWPKFAAYIKRRDGPTCFVCKKTPLVGHDWHAAHCFSAGKYPALRWLFANVFSGCAKCNIWLKGNYIEYHARYKEEFGQEAYDKLHNSRNDTFQWRLPDLMAVDAEIDRLNAELDAKETNDQTRAA